mgnify:FL=1
MSETLYVSDLDGTLLDSDARLPCETAQKINFLLRLGVRITFATARTSRSVVQILSDIDFSLPAAAPVALMNGVLIRDMNSGEYISSAVIERKIAEEVYSRLIEKGAEPYIYTVCDTEYEGDALRTYYRKISCPAMRSFLDERVERYSKPFFKICDFYEVIGDVVYFCVLGEEKTIKEAYASVSEISSLNSAVYRDSYNRSVWYLEIFSCNASKRHAVRFLRTFTGADEIVCFGDNINDIPMFEESDRAVAVENAVAEAKNAADEVCRNVADYIEKDSAVRRKIELSFFN